MKRTLLTGRSSVVAAALVYAKLAEGARERLARCHSVIIRVAQSCRDDLTLVQAMNARVVRDL